MRRNDYTVLITKYIGKLNTIQGGAPKFFYEKAIIMDESANSVSQTFSEQASKTVGFYQLTNYICEEPFEVVR